MIKLSLVALFAVSITTLAIAASALPVPAEPTQPLLVAEGS